MQDKKEFSNYPVTCLVFTLYTRNYHVTCNRVYSNSDYYRITRYCQYRFPRTHNRQISDILAPEYWGNSHFSRSALMCNVRNNEGVADVHFSKRYLHGMDMKASHDCRHPPLNTAIAKPFVLTQRKYFHFVDHVRALLVCVSAIWRIFRGR